MNLQDLFNKIEEIREKNNISKVFICGGAARDKYMDKLENVSDLDLTTGDKTIDFLSSELFLDLKKQYNITRKVMSDGHSTIFIGNLKIDFSSNFVIDNIDDLLLKINVKPNDILREMYSRDFTCNSLLMSMDLKKISDPTNNGFKDIKNKKIMTCLDPEVTLTSNRNRVVRAIYLACKLGFEIDQRIIDYVKSNPESVKISTARSINDKLTEAFEKDADKASFYLTKMNLWSHIPISEKLHPFYTKYLKDKNG